jgi:hypothetical protein
LNWIGFDSSSGLVIEQTIQVPAILPVIIATGLIIIKASTDNSRGKLAAGATGATTCTAAVGVGCVAHWLAVGHAAGDALALAGVKWDLVVRLAGLPPVVLRGEALTLAGRKIGLVDKPMLAKRSSLESGLDFLGAVFWTGFLLPRLVILLMGLLFPPR